MLYILKPEPKTNKQAGEFGVHVSRKWSSSELGPELWESILFVYTLLGCDTSRIFGIGKTAAQKKFESSKYL